jgi:hypothetical protein
MFTEIIGNTDLHAEDACGCFVHCRQNCYLGCLVQEIPKHVVYSDDLSLTSEALSIQF